MEHRTVVVTGGSMGIGRAVAKAFVQAGFNAMLCARGPAALEETATELTGLAHVGRRVLWKTCDVSDESQVAALAEEVGSQFGGCDVLINNAGVPGPIGPLESVDWSEWKRTLEINLHGVVLPCRAFIPQLKRSARGKILNFSGGGSTNSRPNFGAYAAAKTAVVRVSEILADELRDFGIDVNTVAPGAVRTRMNEATQHQNDDTCPPTLAAELCLFLASAACDGITGRLISARWDDWKSLPSRKNELAGTDLFTLRRVVPRDGDLP